MPTNKVSIVPVHLEPTPSKPSTDRVPLKPICVIQANQLKISFYHGVKNHVIQTILQELTKNDSWLHEGKNIYIICGRTDIRKGIDGLAALVQDTFKLDPYSEAVFLFSGWKRDRYKCLYFDEDGFALLYKLLDNGRLQWPKNEEQVRQLTKMIYGSRSEKSKYQAPNGQCSLFEDDPSFNEPEHTGNQSEDTITYAVTHAKKKKKRNDVFAAWTETEEIHHHPATLFVYNTLGMPMSASNVKKT